ncbi:uncharacterized protein N7483_012977 [Penicillium malachiteum]|uniref:uncharacterized protein n=1 Tax=Penicillium malachiteum TaxID=1324776 RepID=UPI0025490054|nr:uncharacterized protein N7483_012977 [Penicillium malachiteum]KAJ5715796.1 hypothetical protein N7483_012977 [Penicillium malachiteum]
MADTTLPIGALLLGSLPLSSNEEVLSTMCQSLTGRLKYIPDGETGERYNWIRWEAKCFPSEALEPFLGGVPLPDDHAGFSQEDVKPSQLDRVAIELYAKFKDFRSKGIIPVDVRFQVCLPTPLSCIQGHCRADVQAQIEPFYEKRVYDAMQSIVNTIPAEDLAIQLDICFEVIALEYDQVRMKDVFFKPNWSPVRQGIIDRIQRMAAIVPNDVPLGIHLCYGDLDHKRFIDPEDLKLSVDFANDLAKALQPHQIDWLHVHVPKDRDDVKYFEPLRELNLGQNRDLYLGVIHFDDEEGDLRRIKAAQAVVPNFGIGTECSIGRTPAEQLESLLQATRKVSRSLSASV